MQVLSVPVPAWMEIMFLRVMLANGNALLLCAMYRPWWHRSEPLIWLSNHLDEIMESHRCQNMLIAGDLNQPEVPTAFTELMLVHGLTNYVTFPTHRSGSSLDPVLSDLPDGYVRCRPLDYVGSSDHIGILTSVSLSIAMDECTVRTIWAWNRADWTSIRRKLNETDWDSLLSGDVNEDVATLTSFLLELQYQYVPHRVYTTRPGDPPWFGYRCQVAAEAKYKAWERYKGNPTARNRRLHKQACKEMTRTCRWARETWRRDLRNKLGGTSVGCKEWWTIIKEQQGHITNTRIPVLTKSDGGTH